ncbi:MAG: hypothetical protein ACK5LN_13175 [Propioniciclava sp.]
MIVFYIIGGIGIGLLVLALVIGEVLDGLLGFDGIDSIAALDSDLFSTAGIAGLLGGFGFGGALGLALSDSMPVGIVVGVAIGIALGFGAGKLTQVLRRQGSGEAPSTETLVGREARVITAIPSDGYGQVRLTDGAHTRTLNAKSPVALESGARVWVSGVLTPTSVEVRPTAELEDLGPAAPSAN